MPTPLSDDDLPELSAPDGSERSADADLLERALRRLADDTRVIVVLKDVYGWSCEEIARTMGITEGAVKVRLFRARRRLADELASEGVVVPMKRKKSS